MSMTALDAWRDYTKSLDKVALWNRLHPDVVFESPVVHSPQRGREITHKYLVSAVEVLGGPGFKFVGEWRCDNGGVLEFETEIDGVQINGVDIIASEGAAGLIRNFKVMVRPLKAMTLLHRLMGAQLAGASGRERRVVIGFVKEAAQSERRKAAPRRLSYRRAPAEVSPKQLREPHIRLNLPEK